MTRRQTMPQRWLIADERLGDRLWPIIRELPRESGVLVLYRDLPQGAREKILRRLRRIGRGLVIVDEVKGEAVRVHNVRELRRALLARAPTILLSPLFPTASHPEWAPLPRMRAAALTRLAGRNLVALGGMTAKRFSHIERLGFQAWAGIDAFRT